MKKGTIVALAVAPMIPFGVVTGEMDGGYRQVERLNRQPVLYRLHESQLIAVGRRYGKCQIEGS